jgi:heterodisulfide reductase subunit A
VKQAIELKEKFPHSEIYCFYMDLRMFGSGYEELYKESQEKHAIQFIRGRLSEAFENPDGTVLVKIEDTLVGKPLKISLDLLVLLVGMLPSEGTKKMARILDLPLNGNGFLQATDAMTAPHDTSLPGVFIAGSCRAPKNLEDTFADARSAALRIDQYLSGN